MKPYLAYTTFALLFYMQNFIFSLFASFTFVPTILEFILIYLLILLISKTSYPKTFFTIWQSLYLMHFSFMSFFGRVITSSDIYLFFTHLRETYETFIYTLDIYMLAFIISLFIYIVIFTFNFKKVGANLYMLIVLFVLVLLLNSNKTQDSSLLLLKSLTNLGSIFKEKSEIKISKKLTPLRDANVNIVLVIGESMRAREYQTQKYDMFENYFYKTIYAGATSTDVSVPLLINGAIKPSEIDMANNLFTLAKQNNIATAFISVQSEKSMKYIKPYLHPKSTSSHSLTAHVEDIDSYKIIASRDDKDLVKELKKIEKDQTNLIVLQMQGEHSPYIYYPHPKSTSSLSLTAHVDKNDDISTRYAHSMNYSNEIIIQMIEYIKTLNKESIFIFTSDHGELLGEGGSYGHNTFKEQVYRVPLVIADSLNTENSYEDILSHNGIYNLIFYYLGYSKSIKKPQKSIRVNGTMINEEDGYKTFDIISK
ncbi:MAG: sulfatase-like hydrolase/transferase [Campylobacterota bacterium]|nr:sulfatase-like hydrolase/transferase [Campylobacterota bacterium]